ncbi:MAG: CPBP family glutamic-type intramembrane protease [Gammaproteobacteria bacterium]|nr:CPBP family glutamic-type intramembrane protease [Gammaproteobacteria bacterium]
MLAVFGPSAFAFFGFHWVLPRVVNDGISPILGWGIIAGIMLAILTLLAFMLLTHDARKLNISLKARLCLTRVSTKQWIYYLLLALLLMLFASIIQPTLAKIWQALDFVPPEYYPFFLRGVDPAATPLEQLSPGLPLLGAYWLLPIMAIVLALNILAEDFYFRAWLMPKMSWIGRPTWIVNGFLFAFYHTFQLWLLPILLLASLIFAFVVWHSKSIVPSLVLHFVLNFLFSILGMLALITGLAP